MLIVLMQSWLRFRFGVVVGFSPELLKKLLMIYDFL